MAFLVVARVLFFVFNVAQRKERLLCEPTASDWAHILMAISISILLAIYTYMPRSMPIVFETSQRSKCVRVFRQVLRPFYDLIHTERQQSIQQQQQTIFKCVCWVETLLGCLSVINNHFVESFIFLLA